MKTDYLRVQLSYIGKELNSPKTQTWIPNSLSLVQAVISPLVALTSDAFQARKVLLTGSTLLALIGSATAPGSSNIYRLVIAQTLIGFGASGVALAYCVPSEILPRKWRPSTSRANMLQVLVGVMLTSCLLSGAGRDRCCIKSGLSHRTLGDRCLDEGEASRGLAHLLRELSISVS